MEAILRSSGVAALNNEPERLVPVANRAGRGDRDASCRIPTRRKELADRHAPPVGVPLRFMIFGFLCLATAVGWIVARPGVLAEYHYSPEVVALTHLVVLGWIGSVVMGAGYQVVPVALETRLANVRHAHWHFIAHVLGVPGMVWMFLSWDMKQVGHYGSLFALGVGLFVVNMFRTIRHAPQRGVVGWGIGSAWGWLVLTVLAGLYVASVKCWPQIGWLSAIPQMHAHAHLGILGCFFLLLVAVSYRILPMFLLADLVQPRRAAWSIVLLNLGTAVSVGTVALESSWRLLGAGLVCAGFGLYLAEVAALVHRRQRRRLDWGLTYFLTALAALIPLGLVGLVLSWPGLALTEWTGRLEGGYGFLAVMGVLTMAMLGMMSKIVPFLVWYGSYSARIGRETAPLLTELYDTRLQAAGYWLLVVGVGGCLLGMLLGASVVIRCGALSFAVGLLTFGVNLVLILRHYVAPVAGRPIG